MRILHLSDLHIEPTPEERLPGLMATLARDRVQIRRSGAELAFVSGDLTTYGCARHEHLALAKDWLDDLELPYIVAAGNHDLGANARLGELDPVMSAYEDVPYAETGFGKVFGPDPIASTDLGQLRVIGCALREDDPDGVLPRLEALAAEDERPIILFTHYPIVDPREPRVHPSFGSNEYVPNTVKALHSLISRHQNIRIYAAGHVHISSAREIAPHCVQLTAGSLGQGSSTYRAYEIDDNGLTYTSILGSGPLGFWAGTSAEFSLGETDERTGRIEW